MIRYIARHASKLVDAITNQTHFKNKLSEYAHEITRNEATTPQLSYHEYRTRGTNTTITINNTNCAIIGPYYWDSNQKLITDMLNEIKPSKIYVDTTPNTIPDASSIDSIASYMYDPSQFAQIRKTSTKISIHESDHIYCPSTLSYKDLYHTLSWCVSNSIECKAISCSKKNIFNSLIDFYTYKEIEELLKLAAVKLGQTPDCFPRTLYGGACLLHPHIFEECIDIGIANILKSEIAHSGNDVAIITGSGQPEAICDIISNGHTSSNKNIYNDLLTKEFEKEVMKISLLDCMLEDYNIRYYNIDETTMSFLNDICTKFTTKASTALLIYKDAKKEYYHLRDHCYQLGRSNMQMEFTKIIKQMLE